MAQARIGPTGIRTNEWGILWKGFPFMENRGGYSGPFDSEDAAKTYAFQLMAAHFPKGLHTIERIPTVNPEK